MRNSITSNHVFSDWLAKICGFILLLFLPALILPYFTPLFHWQLDRYAVFDNFNQSYSRDELTSEFDSVLNYLKFPFDTKLDSEFFSNEDILHMQDVRQLYVSVFITVLLSLLLDVISLIRASRLTTATKSTSKPLWSRWPTWSRWSFVFILISLICIFILTWDSSFVWFHQLLFPHNTYWLLNPRTSNLIKYLPEQIFQELLVVYAVLIIIIYLIEKYVEQFLIRCKEVVN